MIPAPSQLYLDALRHTHEAVLEVEVFDPDGHLVGELPTAEVTLTVDGSANVRRTATVVAGIDPWGAESRDTLERIAVDGSAIRVAHGIRWHDNVPMTVELARLVISDVTKVLTESTLSFTAMDRAMLLTDHKIAQPAFALNGTYVSLIERLLHQTLPGEPLVVGAGIDRTAKPAPGKAILWGADRLDEMQRLAEAAGGWLFNDHDGRFVLDDYPLTAAPVWTFDGGDEGVLVDATQQFSRLDTYNAVGVRFSPTGDGDWGDTTDWYEYVFDDDPNSPTRYGGPFGRKNLFVDEAYDMVPSAAEANRVATRKLAEYVGLTRGVSLSAVYNPLLEPGDRVLLRLPDQPDETHIIDRVDLRLGADVTMEVALRQQRSLSTFGGGLV